MEYKAHMNELTEAMAKVSASIPPSEMELDNMMQQFADHQAASQDKCPALLLEAKHQLNVIHEHIHELAIEINVTEQSLVSEHVQIETTYEMINNTHAWKVEEARKCKEKKEENWKMYWILKAELLEMHQIANPSFQANYDYSAWALKHDFSAKTHTIVSTSSFAASSTSTSTGSHSNTATSGITTGIGGFGHGHSTGYTTGFGDVGYGQSYGNSGAGFGYGHSTGFGGYGHQGFSTTQGYAQVTSGFMSGYTGLAQKDSAHTLAEISPKDASLLQAEAEAEENAAGTSPTDPARVQKARAMVQQTKKLANELSACMAEAKAKPEEHKAEPALLETDALPTSVLGSAATQSSSVSPSALEQSRAGYSGGWGGGYSTGYGSYGHGTGFPSYGSSGYSQTSGYTTGFGYGHGHSAAAATTTTTGGGTSTGQTFHSASTYHSSFKVSHSASHSSLSKYTTSSTGTWGSSEECQWQKQSLQVVYIRAYIELTRLLAQYEVVIHEHTCDDYVYETEAQQEKILEAKMVKMTTTVSSFQHKLEAYHTRLTAAYKLEVKIQHHISLLVTRCGEMDATVSSLDKVRDAIQIMGVCPGLGRLTFSIPKWTGQILDGDFDTHSFTDAEIDAQMNKLCADSPPSAGWDTSLMQMETSPVGITYIFRAAETSEIMLRSISDIPTSNTALIPMMGPCPNCEGKEDPADVDLADEHASGHFRVCWDPEAALSATSKREDCTAGKKAVLCVAEQTYNANSTVVINGR
jgi:hypothetical protein